MTLTQLFAFRTKVTTWNFTNQKEMHNFIESPICMGRERVKEPMHPTQKPVKVLSHIIKLASKPDDLVFDPFMGVGSTGVAALNLSREFIGFEINKSYFKAAEKRLKRIHPEFSDLQSSGKLQSVKSTQGLY